MKHSYFSKLSKMRLIIVLSVVVAAVAGAALPTSVEKRQAFYYPNDVQILRYDVDNVGFGNYRYAYEQTDGTRQDQRGEIKNEGREDEALSVRGSFSWVAPDGVRYTITYIADENGYQPTLEEGPGGVIPDAAALSSSLG